MNEVNIYLNGAAGSAAVLTFTYEEWPIYGEISLSGDPEILEFLELQLSMPQPIIGGESYPAPLSKGYLHAYSAARAAANALDLEFVLENPPAYPDREETAQLWRDVPYIGKDMYSEMMERDRSEEMFSDTIEYQEYSRAANPDEGGSAKRNTKRPRKKPASTRKPRASRKSRREVVDLESINAIISTHSDAIDKYVSNLMRVKKDAILYEEMMASRSDSYGEEQLLLPPAGF